MKRNESQWPPSSQPLYSRWQGNTGSTNQYQLLYIFSGLILSLLIILIIESRQAQGAVFPQMSIQPADTSQLEQLLHF